jgi:hypothetical protein
MFYFAKEVVVRNVGVGFVPIISYVAIIILTGIIHSQFLSRLVSFLESMRETLILSSASRNLRLRCVQ